MYPSILLNHSHQKKSCYGDTNIWMLLSAKRLKQHSHLQGFFVHVKHPSIVLLIYFCVSQYKHGEKRGGETNSCCSHPNMHSGLKKAWNQNWSIPDCMGPIWKQYQKTEIPSDCAIFKWGKSELKTLRIKIGIGLVNFLANATKFLWHLKAVCGIILLWTKPTWSNTWSVMLSCRYLYALSISALAVYNVIQLSLCW